MSGEDDKLASLFNECDRLRERIRELEAGGGTWFPMEDIPPELKDGCPVLVLIPCYGHYNERGKLRGYLMAIVSWKYGQWNEVGVGKREPAYWCRTPAPLVIGEMA